MKLDTHVSGMILGYGNLSCHNEEINQLLHTEVPSHPDPYAFIVFVMALELADHAVLDAF